MRVAICDDEEMITACIEQTMLELSNKISIKTEVDVFFDGCTLVDYIRCGYQYDIIYLDIVMKHKNGIETAKEIRAIDKRVLIIYVTNHGSYAKEVFEVAAFRFVEKPINTVAFARYFIDATNELYKDNKYFQFQYNRNSYRIAIDDILYFQSEGRVTYIITKASSKKCHLKINDIEKRFIVSNIFFLRTHQSFLVNPKYISTYCHDFVELFDGTTLTISENRRRKMRELLCALKGEDIIV